MNLSSLNQEKIHELALAGRLSRRDVVKRATALGLSAPVIAALLAACGGDDDDDSDGADTSGGTGSESEPTATEVVEETDDSESESGSGAENETEEEAEATNEPDSGPTTESEEESAGGATVEQLVIGVDTEPSILDPTRSVQTPNRFIYGQIFDPLIHQVYHPTMEYRPKLATEWEYSDDRTLRFHLREGVTFHNGEPFTAESVKFSMELYADPTSQAATKTTPIEEVQIVDDYTVDVVMFESNPLVIHDFANGFHMVPPQYYQEVGAEGFAEAPIGTGPFVFQEWVRGDHMTVTANPDYFEGPPTVQEAIFRYVVEESTRVAGLQTGEFDIATAIAPALAPELDATGEFIMTNATDPAIIYVGFKWAREEPMSDVDQFLGDNRVRQALSFAVNKDLIVERLLFGYATVANQTAFPDAFGFNPNIPAHEYNPDRAKELLAEAGFPDGFDGTIEFGAPVGLIRGASEVCQAIIGDWEAIGVSAELIMTEVAVFSAEHLRSENREGLEPIHMYRKAYPSLDVGQTMYTAFPCGADWNYNNYCNPEVDELVAKQSSTIDQEVREEALWELAEVLYEDHPYVWVYFTDHILGTRQGIDYHARNDGIVHINDVNFT